MNTEAAVKRNLKVSGGYAYLEAVDSLNHVWLPDRSRHQGHVGIEYVNPRWGLVANLRGTCSVAGHRQRPWAMLLDTDMERVCFAEDR